jgi:5-methyltetrahydropteroyltriglutamate--homocysteine methyltransferase
MRRITAVTQTELPMPRIRTTVVGSYPIPDWLVANPSEQALMDATRVVISTQEQAGVEVVCDGELYRFDINHPETNGMIEYFVRPMDGITQRFSFDDLIAYRSKSGMKFRTRPPGTVIGPIGHGSLDLPLACARAKALATRTFKFTVTGPHMLAKTLINKHYADTPELAHAIADALAAQVRHLNADVVQIDEANLPGHPEEWEWAASAVHLCFGNYGGQTVQQGTWDRLINYLNALHADHVVLECAHRPPEELQAFRDLKPEIGFGLGVVDIKVTDVESADQVARAIERAEKVLGAGRVRYIHPDCGFWMLKRPIADAKMRALALGRDRFEGITTQ